MHSDTKSSKITMRTKKIKKTHDHNLPRIIPYQVQRQIMRRDRSIYSFTSVMGRRKKGAVPHLSAFTTTNSSILWRIRNYFPCKIGFFCFRSADVFNSLLNGLREFLEVNIITLKEVNNACN